MHHGCPFKNFDETQLRVTLQQLQVASSEIGSIVEKVKGQHYQIACGKYFEAKHKARRSRPKPSTGSPAQPTLLLTRLSTAPPWNSPPPLLLTRLSVVPS